MLRRRQASQATPGTQASRRSGPRPEDVLLIGFLLAVVAIAAVAVVLMLDDTSDGAHQDPAELVHVHGLGINPGDGQLYAASHSGLFRIESKNEAVRIAQRYQDTMGFTVAGPNRFLASGHPDLREKALQIEGKPPLLGLIESTDAGETWTPISLLGESDFHSLNMVEGLIVGYDSVGGRVLVSSDGTTWETRSVVPLRDLTAKPDDATQMAALDLGGNLVRSADGGRSWTIDRQAPVGGAVVRWGTSGMWIGGEDGVLHREDAGSGRWVIARRFDSGIEALLSVESDLYVATMSEGILYSPDQGQDWAVAYEPRS
jgi:hypothetical protein